MKSAFAPSHRRRFGAMRAALPGPGGLGIVAPAEAAAPGAVSPETARAGLAGGRAIVFDIREPTEHAAGVAAGARLLPMRRRGARRAAIPTDPVQPVLLICRTQNRSRATLAALRGRGCTHLRHVEGGMSEWARRGRPMAAPAR